MKNPATSELEGEPPSIVAQILVQEGIVSTEDVTKAERIRAKLTNERPLVDVICELHGVTQDAVLGALSKHREGIRLGDLLVELGYLRREYLDTALELQRANPAEKRRVGEILLEHKFIGEEELAQALAIHLGFPFEDPELSQPGPEVMEGVQLAWCRRHDFVPVRAQGEAVVVVFADPTDTACVEAASSSLGGRRLLPAIGCRSKIVAVLEQLGRDGAAKVTGSDGEVGVVEIVEKLLTSAIERGASDIHIEPREDRLSIRFREDGVLVPYRDLPTSLGPQVSTRIKVLCKADVAERRRHQDGRFHFEHDGRALDLRVSIYATVHGEKLVMRLLNHDRQLISLEQIGMSPPMLQRFREDALGRASGVVLVTGPTGSGKTTTLYSCIQEIKNDETSIITAEDPVEYVIDGIGQCSINPAIDLTYAETLKHIVRQDPDVIVIGEIRDTFSAATAIQAALTGHKVLTTFHTEDTIGGLLRLLNMDIEAFLVSSTVVSVVAQRLLRKVCSDCAEPYRVTPADLRRLGYRPGALDDATLVEGRGCDACRGSGYRGRIAVFELLVLDSAVRDALLSRKTSHEIREISRESTKLVSLMEDGIAKASAGRTTLREVIRLLPRLGTPRPLPELIRLVGLK